MSDTCSNCKFWSHWRAVVCADDEPQSIGHCVVELPTGEHTALVQIQGLTAEGFYCGQHQPDRYPSRS